MLVLFFALVCVHITSSLSQLDQICLNEDDVPGELQSQNIQVILDPLKQSGEEESAASVVRALHLILSAIDGQSDSLDLLF